MSRPAGYALIELIVAGALGLLLLTSAAGMVIAHERVTRNAIERLARAEALRIPALLMREELRLLAPSDVQALAADSIAARLHRGVAHMCSDESPARAAPLFRYRGIREPDPDKDSLLVIAPDGSESALPLRGVTALHRPDCDADRAALRLDAAAAVPDGSVVLLFESGAYYLSSSALRFRRGAEGRQPLTGEWLDVRSSRFSGVLAVDSGGWYHAGLRLRLRTRGPVAREQYARVTFLNSPFAGREVALP